jgi:glutathione S-transferase
MAAPKLTYFDFDGGRGEVARLAFAIGGVPFVDDRVPFAAWNDRKPHTPFGGLPVLEVDGRSVAQSNGINRFVGKLVGLYPADPWQAACCDEAMDAVEEIGGKIVATFDLSAAEKKAQREALASGSRWLTSRSSCGSGISSPARSITFRQICRIVSRRDWSSIANGSEASLK